MKRHSPLQKLIASAVSAALVAWAPGLGCYEAAAQVYNSAPGANVAPSGQAGAAAGAARVTGVVPAMTLGAPVSIGLSPALISPAVSPAPNAAVRALPGAAGNVALPAGAASNVALPAGAAPVGRVAVGRGANASPAAASRGLATSDGTRNVESQPVVSPAEAGLASRMTAPVRKLLADPRAVAPAAVEIGKMSGAQARDAGARSMDKVLGTASISESGLVAAGAQGAMGTPAAGSGLLSHAPGQTRAGSFFRSILPAPSRPGSTAPNGARSKVARFLGSLAWIGAGAALAVGAHLAAAALAPAIFGAIPAAALWAVGSALVIGPIALYSRYRLSLRDSPRLSGPKRVFDVALGLLAGAGYVAASSIIAAGGLANLATFFLPATVLGLGSILAIAGGETHLKTGLLAAGSTAMLVAAQAALGPLTLGAMLGLAALPAITTLAFFLGRIVVSAESGRPFSIPGSLQQIRFPLYTWVMTGVVFALLTGYSPIWVNAVFAGWMFLGNKKLFNYAYLGAAAFSVYALAMGIASPVVFYALAFLPERAAVWTEALLGRMLKAAPPAPSSAGPAKYDTASLKPARWPQYHYMLKTAIFLATLAGFAVFIGVGIVGISSILTNTAIAAGLAFVPLLFAKKLIKTMMKAEPTDETKDPEVFAIMKELRDRINAERAAKGKKPIPMPEIVNIPAAAMPVPNAFATGMSPFSALVGVTEVFKGMVLEPEALRAGLIRMLNSVDPQSKAFKAFRLAIAGSIPGIGADSGPQAVIAAVRGASKEQLKALGYRAMRGVLGHEFNHVMHRDMMLGAIAGAQSSGIAFASYGVLWAVGHARYLVRKLLDWIRGRASDRPGVPPPGASLQTDEEEGTRNLGVKPEMVEPVSTGLAIKTIAGLAKVFIALWAPIIAQLLQMASSRTREAHADEGGALTTEDPASLALGLGLLMAWRPAAGYAFDRRRTPYFAATQHLFTVNPGEQLLEAGVLASSGRFEGRPVEKADNAFFNLFITHPDTNERIEKLYDMALATEAKKRASRGGSGGRAAEGTRNLGPGGPQARLLRHHDDDGPPVGGGPSPDGGLVAVDGDTDEGLSTPGLDARLSRVVDVMTQEIGSDADKRRRLGHLTAALQSHLADGGVVRYTGLAAGGQLVPSFYDAASKALYLNQALERSNPKLQAALLAAQLQELYDSAKGRAQGTREAAARQVLALDLFLSGTDMTAMAEAVDINNPLEVGLFESQLQNRQWAASGSAAFEQVFGELSSVPQMLQRARDQVALLERQAADLADELVLVRGGLSRGRDAELERQERVLEERERILGGSVLLARAQLSMLEKEAAASGGKLETPLAVAERVAPLPDGPLPVVPVKAKPAIDARLAEPVALIRNVVASTKDPAIKGLAPVVDALERLIRAGGRVRLAPSGEDAAAYFSPVTLDLVVGRQFANSHPALVAAMMVHELTHALDYFEGRPLTLETERNAFTNEAIFAGAFDPRVVAAKLDVRNPVEQGAYQLIYHARARYVEGDTSLESMISEAYRTLFGAHFEGLQTASQLLEETVRSRLKPLQAVHAQMLKRRELLEGAVKGGDRTRRSQLEALDRNLALTSAHLRLLERQVDQLQAVEGGDETAAAKPSGGRSGPQLKPARIFPSAFGPKLGLSIPRDGPDAAVAPAPALDPRLGGRAAFGPATLAHAELKPEPQPPATGPPAAAAEEKPPRADAEAARGTAQSEARAGLFRRAWRSLKGLLQVLPEKGRNREYWKFVLIQALLAIGQSFHYTALPGLIAPRQEDSSRLGVNRAVNWGSQAASNLATGPLVDRAPVQGLLIATHAGRAVLLVAVPVMFFLWTSGMVAVPWLGAVPAFILAFQIVIGLHGFLQATSVTAGTVAFSRILGSDSRYYARANAIYNIVVSIVGVAAPLAAGAFIGWVDGYVGMFQAGNAAVYLVYGLLLGAAAAGFSLLKVPRDPVLQARRELAAKLKESPPDGAKVKGVAAREEDGVATLLVEVSADPAEVSGLPETFQGYPVKAVPQRRVLKELVEGFRVLWSIRFLRLVFLFSALNLLVADSLVFTVLPLYIKSLGVESASGAFGFYLASGALGLALSSGWLALRKNPEAKDEPKRRTGILGALLRPFERLSESQRKRGMDSLDRQGWWTAFLYGAASLFYWVVFFSPSLPVSIAAMLVLSTMQGFAMVVWPALYQKVLMRERPHDMGKAYSAMYFYQLVLSVVGVLGMGALISAIPLSAALWTVGVIMTIVAILQFIEMGLVFPSR